MTPTKLNPKNRNRVNREVLRQRVAQETTPRTTLSFYKYVSIADPYAFRESLYEFWSSLGARGRIYVSTEGINAQMNVPTHNWSAFTTHLDQHELLAGTPLKIAVQEDPTSFIKLDVKVRKRIVADGLQDDEIDLQNIGKHIHADEMNAAIENPDSLIIDMRNHYEYEIGHFEGAVCPDTATFREALPKALDMAKDHKEKEVVLYCTGGIRCEKASAYFRAHGFSNVKQMCGGIIDYAHEVEHSDLPNRYRGKNFVFDERKAETISHEVISTCHQCDQPADTHVNCANPACHLLFIQCATCTQKYGHHCSPECQRIAALPKEEQKALRKAKASSSDQPTACALNVYARHEKRDLRNQNWS